MRKILTMIFLSSVFALEAGPINKNDTGAVDKSNKSPYSNDSMNEADKDMMDDNNAYEENQEINELNNDEDTTPQKKSTDNKMKSQVALKQATQAAQATQNQTGNMTPEDQALNKKIGNVLQKFHGISYSMSGGNVVLTGNAKTDGEKTNAESQVRNISGVNNVVNRINVKGK